MTPGRWSGSCRSGWALAFVLATFVCLVAPASAGEPAFSSAPGFMLSPARADSTTWQVTGGLGYVGKSEFTNGLGSVSVIRGSVTADYSIFRFNYALSHFMWERKGAVTFSSADARVPWENLHDVTFQARLLDDTLDGRWHYWVNGEINSSFEQDFPGAVGVGFDGGMTYDFWDGWMLGITAKTVAVSALSSDLFGDIEFGLVLAVSQKTLRDTLKALGLISGAKDGSERIGFSVALSGAEKTYRLSSDSPVRRNGYLGLVRSKVGAYLDYSATDRLTLSFGPEYHYTRQYKLYDSSGSLHSSHDLHDAWGGNVRCLYRF